MEIAHTSYIYAAQLIPMFEADPHPVIKIGKSDIPNAREMQLSKTNMPYTAKFIRVWAVPKDIVLQEEGWLHDFYEEIRIGGLKTEWFTDYDGVLIGKLDMQMRKSGFEQILDLEELDTSVSARKSSNPKIDFWNAFDKVVPSHISPKCGSYESWGRWFRAGKSFSYEYQPRNKDDSFISLYLNSAQPHRVAKLYEDSNQEYFRGLFPNVEFNSARTRIKVYVEGNRDENPEELQQNMIRTMDAFVSAMSPILSRMN